MSADALLPRSRAAPGRSAGFTLFELIVALLVISIVAAALAGRALDNFELAEKAAMETQYLMIKSGMDLEIAGLISAGRGAEVARIGSRNPMDWLKEKPSNYRGEFAGDPAAAVPPGNWYFDTASRQLVYLPRRREHLAPDSSGIFRVRYQVLPAAAVSAGSRAAAAWPVLAPVESYKWF